MAIYTDGSERRRPSRPSQPSRPYTPRPATPSGGSFSDIVRNVDERWSQGQNRPSGRVEPMRPDRTGRAIRPDQIRSSRPLITSPQVTSQFQTPSYDSLSYEDALARVMQQTDPLHQQALESLRQQTVEQQGQAGEFARSRGLAQSGLAPDALNKLEIGRQRGVAGLEAERSSLGAQMAQQMLTQDQARQDEQRRQAFQEYIAQQGLDFQRERAGIGDELLLSQLYQSPLRSIAERYGIDTQPQQSQSYQPSRTQSSQISSTRSSQTKPSRSIYEMMPQAHQSLSPNVKNIVDRHPYGQELMKKALEGKPPSDKANKEIYEAIRLELAR